MIKQLSLVKIPYIPYNRFSYSDRVRNYQEIVENFSFDNTVKFLQKDISK